MVYRNASSCLISHFARCPRLNRPYCGLNASACRRSICFGLLQCVSVGQLLLFAVYKPHGSIVCSSFVSAAMWLLEDKKRAFITNHLCQILSHTMCWSQCMQALMQRFDAFEPSVHKWVIFCPRILTHLLQRIALLAVTKNPKMSVDLTHAPVLVALLAV